MGEQPLTQDSSPVSCCCNPHLVSSWAVSFLKTSTEATNQLPARGCVRHEHSRSLCAKSFCHNDLRALSYLLPRLQRSRGNGQIVAIYRPDRGLKVAESEYLHSEEIGKSNDLRHCHGYSVYHLGKVPGVKSRRYLPVVGQLAVEHGYVKSA